MLANEHVGGPSELVNRHEHVLETWGENFINLRYPYEKYSALTEKEYIDLGNDWVAQGADSETATFQLYPNELFGFLHAANTIANEHATKLFGSEWGDQ